MENNVARHITTADFDTLIAEEKPTFVDFWAPWCGPCKMIGPYIEQIAVEFAGQANICKVNVDEEPTLAERYNVATIPTVLLFKSGDLLEKSVGAKPKQQFIELIKKHM